MWRSGTQRWWQVPAPTARSWYSARLGTIRRHASGLVFDLIRFIADLGVSGLDISEAKCPSSTAGG